MALRLRAAFSKNPRVTPLLDGTIRVPGVEFDWDDGTAGELHERHLRDSAHDVFEFSISNFLVTRERDEPLWDWVMLPIFASKATLGLKTWVHGESAIHTGADLRDVRFGIPDFTMTAGLWFRAQLRTLWGISTRDIEWVIARQGEQSHAHQMGVHLRPPEGVTLQWSSPSEVADDLQTGRIDAAFPSADVPIDGATGRVRRLFPDRGRTFFADFHRQTSFLPVNHAVFVQRRLLDREPWLAPALVEAFAAARDESFRRDPRSAGVFLDDNDDIEWQREVFGADPFAYGVAANAGMLSMAAEQSHLDGLTSREHDLSSLIPAGLD